MVLSTIAVNTFVDQNDAPGSPTVSLRDAIAIAAAAAGADTINVPTGVYKLTQGELAINDGSGAVTIQGVGGLATIDGQAKSPNVININKPGAVVNLTNIKVTGARSRRPGRVRRDL